MLHREQNWIFNRWAKHVFHGLMQMDTVVQATGNFSRSQDVTLHLSDFRDKCECISLRWHALIRHYIVDKRVVLVQTVWHKHASLESGDSWPGWRKLKSRFSSVKYNFSEMLPVPSVAFDLHGLFILDIYRAKKKSPPEMKMQNHTFMLGI